jgi:hypothetical protein
MVGNRERRIAAERRPEHRAEVALAGSADREVVLCAAELAGDLADRVTGPAGDPLGCDGGVALGR